MDIKQDSPWHWVWLRAHQDHVDRRRLLAHCRRQPQLGKPSRKRRVDLSAKRRLAGVV